ncbi:hypothetical protein E3U43_004740, partial [Larimichthys crocea]
VRAGQQAPAAHFRRPRPGRQDLRLFPVSAEVLLSDRTTEPHTESARAVRPRPGRISRLSRGPRPGAGGGLPSPHHSQS